MKGIPAKITAVHQKSPT